MTGLSSFIGLLLQQRVKEFVWRGNGQNGGKWCRKNMILLVFSQKFMPRFHLRSCTCAQRAPSAALLMLSLCVCSAVCQIFFLSAFLLASLVQPLCPLTCHSVLIVELDICLSSREPLFLDTRHCRCGCGSCLLGHPKVESFHHEYVMCAVHCLTGLFNASWQPG